MQLNYNIIYATQKNNVYYLTFKFNFDKCKLINAIIINVISINLI